MKARVYNVIRKSLYKKSIEKFSLEEKAKMFDEIFGLNAATHWELIAYKQKRQNKAAIQAERLKRGIKPKKKTSKEDYLSSLKTTS